MPLKNSAASSIALIVANLVPLYGTLVWDWSVFTIMILYWIESAIIGGFTIAKMRRAAGTALPGVQIEIAGKSGADLQKNLAAAKVFLIPFFLMHFGIFMLVHLLFVCIFFGVMPAAEGVDLRFSLSNVLIGFLSLLASHTLSYYGNYIGAGEYNQVSPAQLFIAPYPRIIVMHMTVIFAGFFIGTSSQNVAAVALMVVLKTVADLGSHLFEHRRISSTFG